MQRLALIIPDEAHHCVSDSWGRLFAAQPQAKLAGFTATPERLDGRGLGDVFQRMIAARRSRRWSQRKHLCPAVVFAPAQGPNLTKVRNRGGDYRADDLALIMDKPSITGDAAYHYESYAPGVAAIGFCSSVAAAEHAAAAFRGEGWSFEAVDGGMHRDRRRELLAALATWRAARADVLQPDR